MRRALQYVLGVMLITNACADRESDVEGCYDLQTSQLSNGSPASERLIRLVGDDKVLLLETGSVPIMGSNEGRWRTADDGSLQLFFGGGFVGVNYTFPTRLGDQWIGTVLSWVDTPVLNGVGTATLAPIACQSPLGR